MAFQTDLLKTLVSCQVARTISILGRRLFEPRLELLTNTPVENQQTDHSPWFDLHFSDLD